MGDLCEDRVVIVETALSLLNSMRSFCAHPSSWDGSGDSAVAVTDSLCSGALQAKVGEPVSLAAVL